MKNIYLFLLLSFSLTAFAGKSYISGNQKVTFRSGPGTDNKVIKMLSTDSAVTVLEIGETWSKVKSGRDSEGYVLNRFLTIETPAILKYKWLRKKFDRQTKTNESLASEKKELKKQVLELQDKLSTTAETLSQTQQVFDELKIGAANYIGLKKKYDTTIKSLSAQTSKVETLESKVSIYYIKWFLAGSGVLVFGWLLGIFSRKKKSYSGIRL